ncbi:hypothetical protein JCM8097_008839 [Rhodosporidiobolus ruineniae]
MLLLGQAVAAAQLCHGEDEKDEAKQTAPLRNLQIHHPPVVPVGGKSCSVELLKHNFGLSYYKPAIAKYNPPRGCGKPGTWAAVILNLTVTSNGTQFDRLASLSLDHVETGQLLFELNNILDDKYTGIFTTTLTATFYEPTDSFPALPRADKILPVTASSKKGSQMLVYPGDASAKVKVPINTAEAWLEIIATGAGDEEFWYTNVLDRWQSYFPEAGLIGKGPLREVQVFVDDTLAGLVYPFPVVYTGGANPLLWRPLASLRAFDIPSLFVDLSPFIPTLTDGKSHNISFKVLGQGEGGTVNDHWFITGALHIVLDPTVPPVRTTGKTLIYQITPEPFVLSAGLPSADSATLKTSAKGTHSVDILAELKTGSGTKRVRWGQAASFANRQYYADNGTYESVNQETNVIYTSMHGPRVLYRDTYRFALSLRTNYTSLSTSGTFSASLPEYIYNRALSLPPSLGGVSGKADTTRSEQRGWAAITGKEEGRSVGRGEMQEEYDWMGVRDDSYWEVTKAVNSTIASRRVGGTLAHKAGPA